MVVLFDVDDTLLDDAGAVAAAASALHHRLALSEPLDVFLARWRLSRDEAHQLAKLSHPVILERFRHVVISEDIGVAKPDRRTFAHACALFDVEPECAIHIGDSLEADVFGAARAGLSPVGSSETLPQQTPHARFRSFIRSSTWCRL